MSLPRIEISMRENERWVFDAAAECGQRFHAVAILYEPLTANPILHIPSPLGLRATKQVMRLIEEERAKIGLTTLQ